jgi:ABC-type phosphate/phosphonate transport system permease subunit
MARYMNHIKNTPNKKTIVSFLGLSITIALVILMFWFRLFRLTGTEMPAAKNTGSMFELVFNKEITNPDAVEKKPRSITIC